MPIRVCFVRALASVLLASPIVACSLSGASDQSALSGEHDAGAGSDADAGCTLTQGYWKNHAGAWPATSLELGTRTYAKVELMAILETPVRGNGLVALAHQLIAAKLNVAAGAADAEIGSAIADADARIGALVVPPIGVDQLPTSLLSPLTATLDAFNSGATGPGHCDDHGEGDGGSGSGDTCDDGSNCDHGGCDAPVCGNGVIEVGETCDDGNTNSGDGCSSACTCEPCP